MQEEREEHQLFPVMRDSKLDREQFNLWWDVWFTRETIRTTISLEMNFTTRLTRYEILITITGGRFAFIYSTGFRVGEIQFRFRIKIAPKLIEFARWEIWTFNFHRINADKN